MEGFELFMFGTTSHHIEADIIIIFHPKKEGGKVARSLITGIFIDASL